MSKKSAAKPTSATKFPVAAFSFMMVVILGLAGVVVYFAVGGEPSIVHEGIVFNPATQQCRPIAWRKPFYTPTAKQPTTVDGQPIFYGRKLQAQNHADDGTCATGYICMPFVVTTPYGQCNSDNIKDCCTSLGFSWNADPVRLY